MILFFGKSGQNSVRATQLHTEKHPNYRYLFRLHLIDWLSLFYETVTMSIEPKGRLENR